MSLVQTTLKEYAQLTHAALEEYLPQEQCPQSKVIEAMRYSLLAGGKRLRAALALEFCREAGGEAQAALPAACALEMVHAYSLIHDDLPCMDDDALRRGKPACHIVFGEDTALLAGDALQSKAFEVLLGTNPGRLQALAALELAQAIGAHGMVGGQVLDLENEEAEQVTPSRLKATDAMKTGALIKAACIMGCIMGEASPQLAAAAQGYAEKIGLAFQLTDDMLDVTGTTEELGKPAGSDKQQHKATYVSLYGLEQVEAMAKGLLEEAKACLKNAKVASAFLYDLTDYILYRKN